MGSECVQASDPVHYLFFVLAYYWVEFDSKVKEIMLKPLLYFMWLCILALLDIT